MRKLCSFVAAILISSSLVWGATTPAAAKAAAKTTQTPKISDADLEKAINAKFLASKISTDKFKAHVQGGVATLEGYTEVVQHKGTATRLWPSPPARWLSSTILRSARPPRTKHRPIWIAAAAAPRSSEARPTRPRPSSNSPKCYHWGVASRLYPKHEKFCILAFSLLAVSAFAQDMTPETRYGSCDR